MILDKSGLAATLIAALLLVPSHGWAQDGTTGNAGGPVYIPPDDQNISGHWWIQSYSPNIELADGGVLSFTEEGQARYLANITLLEQDPLNDESRKFCLPDGVPRILGNPYPFQILQTPRAITIIYELNRVVRRIFLDVPQAEDEWIELFPYYSGHSVGHWEDDVLVIETAGYNDKTFIDATGVPHSSRMHTIERLRKLDRNILEIVVTVDDPEIFDESWSARFVYELHPDLRLQDYTCGEEHRDISHIPGVNRPN